MGELRFADVAEGVRAAIAQYTLAMDDGRTDDVVATFCPDGSVDLPGMGTPAGADELWKAYQKVTSRIPQRHVVVNTHVHTWNDEEAQATSDVVFLLQRDDVWSVALVGRYDDLLHRDGDRWRFHHRRATFT
jgi:hypothetical protein